MFSFTVEYVEHDGTTETIRSRIGKLDAVSVVKMLMTQFPEGCKEIRVIPRMEADE